MGSGKRRKCRSDDAEIYRSGRQNGGHFRGDAYTGAPRVTFLREPIANLLSIYFFWRNYPPSDSPIHQKFQAEKPDILNFAMYPGVSNLMSDGYFGGIDMSAFDFIGFNETRRRDLRRFSEQFGIPVDTDLHVNRTERSDGEQRAFLSDLRALASLRFLLRKDIAFYEEQVRRFG